MPMTPIEPEPERPRRPFRPRGNPITASFQRTKALWQLPSEQVTLGVSTLISVRLASDQGPRNRLASPSALAQRAAELDEQGAALVEVQPWRVGSDRGIPTAETEISRLVPIVRRVIAACNIPVSVICWNAESARKAVDLGASVIHDPTGLTYDKAMAPTVNESGAALIIGHMRGTPQQWPRMAPLTRLIETVRTDFRASLLRAAKAGIERRRIVLDPGLEHGKRGNENFDLLRSMRRLGPPGQGLQATLAGRQFMVESIRASDAERNAGLSVAATLAVQSGAHILAVDDYQPVQRVVSVVDRIYKLDDESVALTASEPDTRRPSVP